MSTLSVMLLSLYSTKTTFRTLSNDEMLNIAPMRRTLRAYTDINIGDKLSPTNLVYTALPLV